MKRRVKVDRVVNVFASAVMRRKLQAAIETKLLVVLVVVRQRRAQMDRTDAGFFAILSPDSRALSRIGKALRLLDNQKLSPV